MHRMKLLGGAQVTSAGGPLAGRGVQRRRLALLILLAMARNRAKSRESLAAVLWPEADSTSSRHHLSDSVYRINQAIGATAIVATGEELALDLTVVSCDAVDFRALMAEGDWEGATELYEGPFLAGFFVSEAPDFESWSESERVALARDYQRALEELAERDERAGRTREAVEHWRRAAVQDPLSSRVALRLMRALDAVGEREAAIRHARIHSQLVEQELAAPPAPEVAAFAESLRSAPPVPTAPVPTAPVPAAPVPQAPSSAQPISAERSPTAPMTPERMPAAEEPPRIAAVEPAEEPPRSSVASKPGWRWRRPWVAVVLLVVAATLTVAGSLAWDRWAPAAAPAPDAIAVLPFTNLSGDDSYEYVSDGVTEELIATLSEVPGLRVASRSSAFALKGQSIDVREAARRLGVGTVLEGSVRRSGDRLRVTAQLVNASDGLDLWSQSFDREVRDVLAIQEEIARAIVARLRRGGGELAAPPAERAAGRAATGRNGAAVGDHPADAPEAYDLYLKGRYAWHKRTEEGLRAAVGHFTAATQAAPRYALAYAGLADALAVLGFYDYLPPREAFPAARVAAERAVAIDAMLAAPHATLGYVALYHDWTFPRAEEEFRRAIALDPNYSTAHQWYANFLTSRGRFDEAIAEMRRAQELDPLSLIANAALGWVHLLAGRNDEAVAQLQRALELDRGFQLAWLWLGQAEEERGRDREAMDALRTADRLSGGSALTRTAIARAHALAGRADSARAVLAALERRAARGYLPSYEIARVRSALGDHDATLAWIARAIDERAHSSVFLRVDPAFTRLRQDARFAALVRRVEGDDAR